MSGGLGNLSPASNDNRVSPRLPWSYSLTKTELQLDAAHVRWPQNPTAFICTFDLTVKGRVCLASSPAKSKGGAKQSASKPAGPPPRKDWEDFVAPANDPCWRIDELKCDLQLLARSGGAPKWEQFWHFDRHIPSTKPGCDPLEIHPLFHFHFGGDSLAEGRIVQPQMWGSLLELHAPRIAHPPLDLVLLIDFVLTNFAGNVRRDLIANQKEYEDIIQHAQRRFWCPYKSAMGDYFQCNPQQQNTHLARELWPSLASVAV